MSNTYQIVLKYVRPFISLVRRARVRVKIINLRLRGVSIKGSAVVHWTVEVLPSGGVVEIGENSSLEKGVILRAYGGSIRFGANCTVNPYAVIYGGGGLVIGDGVRIAAHAVIAPSNHNYSDPQKWIYEQGESRQGITIEDDVWIGAGARILDGVIIRKGTVVGAGAVVTKSTDPYAVVVGVPARKISTRK